MAVLLEACVGDTTRVPQLNDYDAALGVHSVSYSFPTSDLIVCKASWRTGVTLRVNGYLRGFGDDQAGRGALRVILESKRSWHQALPGSISGERGHDDAIGECEGACTHGFEQSPNRASLVSFFHTMAHGLSVADCMGKTRNIGASRGLDEDIYALALLIVPSTISAAERS